MTIIILFFQNFLSVFMDSAPWLLLGLLVAGIIKAFIPAALLAKHLGKNNAVSVIKAALFGAPLPLCSCGVIPAALGLYRSGASKAATTSFLISTPETGVDSISISYALLGPFIAIIRPIAALVTAISAGLLVILFGTKNSDVPRGTSSTQSLAANTSCCASKNTTNTANINNSNNTHKHKHKHKHNTSSCCANNAGGTNTSNNGSTNDSKGIKNEKNSSCCSKNNSSDTHSIESNNPTLLQKLSEGLSFTLVKLVKDISLWLLLGFSAAALILTLVPSSFLATWGSSVFAFFVMAAIGIPMYICATASTPIAAGLLFAGVSPGAVLVFLLVGPATNLATMGMVKQELGKKVLVIYVATVVGMGFLFGYITNLASDYFHIDFSKQIAHAHMHQNINYAASVILSLLILNALYKKYIAKN